MAGPDQRISWASCGPRAGRSPPGLAQPVSGVEVGKPPRQKACCRQGTRAAADGMNVVKRRRSSSLH